MMKGKIAALVALSHEIGREDRNLSILGEGNASVPNRTAAGFGAGTSVVLQSLLDERQRFGQAIVKVVGPEVLEQDRHQLVALGD